MSAAGMAEVYPSMWVQEPLDFTDMRLGNSFFMMSVSVRHGSGRSAWAGLITGAGMMLVAGTASAGSSFAPPKWAAGVDLGSPTTERDPPETLHLGSLAVRPDST